MKILKQTVSLEVHLVSILISLVVGFSISYALKLKTLQMENSYAADRVKSCFFTSQDIDRIIPVSQRKQGSVYALSVFVNRDSGKWMVYKK